MLHTIYLTNKNDFSSPHIYLVKNNPIAALNLRRIIKFMYILVRLN
jgi:hypothetical protein